MKGIPSQELIIETIGSYMNISSVLSSELSLWLMELTKIKNSKKEFEECIRTASMPGLDDLGVRIKRDDPTDIIEEAENLLMQQIRFTSDRADQARQKIKVMNRIMICFDELPFQEKAVLEELYKDGIPLKTGKANAMARTGITTERHIRRIRNSGIERIQTKYETLFIKGEYFNREVEYATA